MKNIRWLDLATHIMDAGIDIHLNDVVELNDELADNLIKTGRAEAFIEATPVKAKKTEASDTQDV